MPRGKKAVGRAASASNPKSAKQQSALSFSGRVTKPSTNTRSASTKKADEKAAALERELSAGVVATPIDSQAEDSDVVDSQAKAEPPNVTTSELAIREQAQQEQIPPKSPEDLAAERIPESQIKRYWAGKEAERLTRRVHQEDLSLHEKVLREFDMSYQYGPCTGVARTKRWKLANELGLQPPIEVLSVLIKEDAKSGDGLKAQRPYVDELLNSRFVVD